MSNLRYLWYVLRHKAYVFLACWRLGIPWLGVIHDLSKLLPDEFLPYADHFYGKYARQSCANTGYYYEPGIKYETAFDMAWLEHIHRNRHHWQHYILKQDEDGTKVLPMPDKYRREMLADWRGAGLAQGKPDTLAWYTKNKVKMMLHPETRAWIEQQLSEIN